MWSMLVIGCALIGAEPADATASRLPAADVASYERARKEAGRDPSAHVKLALWCESHGMTSERMKHLAMAVMYDPSNTLARGLLGLVGYRGKWGNPEDIGRKILDDPSYRKLIDEYLERRAATPTRPDAQMKLAAWCDQNGLKAQAIAHYNVVVSLDPTRESAWKHLGYKKVANRWVKPEEAAAGKLEAERQRSADKSWRPRLTRIREALEGKSSVKRTWAEEAIVEITDPRAVPMIWAVFVAGGTERSQLAAVQMFGQIDGAPAAMALATLAILDSQGTVRGRASQTLRTRDPRDIAERLIALVKKPFAYKVKNIDRPGSTGELFIEGETFNVRRLYRSRAIDPGLIPGTAFAMLDAAYSQEVSAGVTPMDAVPAGRVFDPLAMLVAQSFNSGNSARSQRVAQRLDVIRQDNDFQRQRLANDVMEIEATNDQIEELNARVLPILTTMTGKELGAEPEKWRAWWTDQLGYAFQKQSTAGKPTFTEVVDSPSWSAPRSVECFAAGTLVRTIDGPRPIESVQVGDRVLTQETATGALGFQPVLAVHHTPSAATVRVNLDGESLVATGIHRFWKAGQGWVCARDLKKGDRVRALGSVVEVKSVDASPAVSVHNLDVAETHDFFVGAKALLVHDSGTVGPIPAPFDGEPAAK